MVYVCIYQSQLIRMPGGMGTDLKDIVQFRVLVRVHWLAPLRRVQRQIGRVCPTRVQQRDVLVQRLIKSHLFHRRRLCLCMLRLIPCRSVFLFFSAFMQRATNIVDLCSCDELA